MAKNRVVQHRPSEKSKTKEISDLKKEIHQLRRRNSKLQKYHQKLLDIAGAPVEDDEAPVENLAQEPTSGCPECGSHKITQILLPTGTTLRGCKDCGWKKKV